MSDPQPASARRLPVRRAAVVVTVLLALLIGLMIWLNRPDQNPQAAPAPAPTTPSPTPSPKTGPCASQATGELTPTSITVPGIVSKVRVLALPRDAHDVPSTPPVTETGKHQFAWDRPPGIKPGSPQGNVLLNAHTWPDGSALGNQLLKGLKTGDRIIVRHGRATLCYRVDRRTEVVASKGFPAYYDTEGPPQLAIVVCSGRRLGPGNWTRRTIWFAAPESQGDSTSS